MSTQLGIARALLSDPEAEYGDLGPGYYEQREDTRRRTHGHVLGSERLGRKVSIEPLGHGTDPETGEPITRGQLTAARPGASGTNRRWLLPPAQLRSDFRIRSRLALRRLLDYLVRITHNVYSAGGKE